MQTRGRPPHTPFQFGEVFTKSFRVIAENARLFLALLALGMTPDVILEFFAPNLGSADGVVWVGYLIFEVMFSSFMQGAIIAASYLILMQYPVGLTACFGRAGERLIPIVLTNFLFGLGVALGVMAFIVPGFILACGLYLAMTICVIEGRNALESLKRSWRITNGYKRYIAILTLFLIGPLIYALNGGPIDGWIGSLLFTAIFIFDAVACTVFYMMLRDRADGALIDKF